MYGIIFMELDGRDGKKYLIRIADISYMCEHDDGAMIYTRRASIPVKKTLDEIESLLMTLIRQ